MFSTTRRKVAAVIAAAVAASVFTLYETSGTAAAPLSRTPAAAPAQSAPPMPGDPVSILESMHVPIPSSEAVGQVDIFGDRYASGSFADGEEVTVYTYADSQALARDLQQNPSNDANKELVGTARLFTVTVTGVDTGNGISFPVPVSALAQESGTVLD
jgi:hypothetical protein